jgi:hypothetical protein
VLVKESTDRRGDCAHCRYCRPIWVRLIRYCCCTSYCVLPASVSWHSYCVVHRSRHRHRDLRHKFSSRSMLSVSGGGWNPLGNWMTCEKCTKKKVRRWCH